jgi:hypothetical protein
MLDDISDDTEDLVSLADERNELLEDILDELEQQGGGGLSIPFINPGGGRTPKTGGPGGGPTVFPFPIPDEDPSGGPTSTPTPTVPPLRLPNPFGDLPDIPSLPFGGGQGTPSGAPTGSPTSTPTAPPSSDRQPTLRLPGPGGQPTGPGTPDPIDIPGGAPATPAPSSTVASGATSQQPPAIDPTGLGAAGGLAATVGGLAKSAQGALGLNLGGSASPGSGGLGFPLPINPNTLKAVGLDKQIRQNAREIQGQTGGGRGRDRVQVDVSGEVRVDDRRRDQDIIDGAVEQVRRDLERNLGSGGVQFG